MDSTAMILIELIFNAAPDAREEVAAPARRTMAQPCGEKSCILYRFTIDFDIPHRFILTELWESEEDLKAHFGGKAFKTFWAELPGGGNFISSTAWQGPLVSYVLPGGVQAT
jgi:quinol monooxygenase YgiN